MSEMPLPEPPARPASKAKRPSVPIGKDMTKEEISEIMEVMTKETKAELEK